MIFIKRNKRQKKKETQNLCHYYLSNLLCTVLFFMLRINTSANETEMLSLSQIAWASFWLTFRSTITSKYHWDWIDLRNEKKSIKAKTTTKVLLKQKRKRIKCFCSDLHWGWFCLFVSLFLFCFLNSILKWSYKSSWSLSASFSKTSPSASYRKMKWIKTKYVLHRKQQKPTGGQQ